MSRVVGDTLVEKTLKIHKRWQAKSPTDGTFGKPLLRTASVPAYHAHLSRYAARKIFISRGWFLYYLASNHSLQTEGGDQHKGFHALPGYILGTKEMNHEIPDSEAVIFISPEANRQNNHLNIHDRAVGRGADHSVDPAFYACQFPKPAANSRSWDHRDE